MTYGLGVLIFALGILLSVCLHEAGHLLTAKHYGEKATQYFAGFGPTLWSFRRGETEYGVKAIPAGGFVKIIGMTPLEELEPEDTDRAFWRFPIWQRTVVLVSGSVTHFLIAIVIFFIAVILPCRRATRCLHPPERLEAVQVMLARLARDVRRLAHQPSRC